MHLPQHSTAHVTELDTGAQSSREESSVFISDVNHPQFCMLKGQQELRVSSDWLSDFMVTLTDSFITTLPGIPQKSLPPYSPQQDTDTGPHLLPHPSAGSHKWVDSNGHKSACAHWLRHTSGSVFAPDVNFCHAAPACCSAAATALPGPTQCNQSARGAVDSYQCPPFHSVQYCCYNGKAMLCTYQCKQFFGFSPLHWREVWKWVLETSGFWP